MRLRIAFRELRTHLYRWRSV